MNSDVIRSVSMTALICAGVTLTFFFMSQCTARGIVAEEQTKQEAIKAGLQQGEMGRWVRAPR